jgi:hypothetical protein
MIPYENIIEDYSDYYICYNYKEFKMEDNYTFHLPEYKTYKIKYDSSVSSLLLDEDNISEVVTLGKYDFDLYIKNSMPVLKNNNTGSEVKLSDNNTYGLTLVETKTGYVIILVTMDRTYTERVYISNFMTKENISNSDTYLNTVVESFKEINLPDVNRAGYITIEGKDDNYPAFITDDHDMFAIIDEELFVLK